MKRSRSAVIAELTEARGRVFELEAELALLDPAPAALAIEAIDCPLFCQCDECLHGIDVATTEPLLLAH